MPEFHAADSILKCVFKLNISHPVAMYTCKSSDCTVEAALQDMQTPGSTAPAVLLWQSQRIARACPSEASTPRKKPSRVLRLAADLSKAKLLSCCDDLAVTGRGWDGVKNFTRRRAQ